MSFEPKFMCVTQNIDRHLWLAAELARQGPFRALAIRKHAAKNTASRSRTSDLLDFFDAVDSEQANAKLVGASNVALLLDRVAIADAIRRRAGVESHLDFGHGCRVKGRAEPGQQAQDFRCRIGLHCVIDL